MNYWLIQAIVNQIKSKKMITNFEEITKEMTEDEKKLVPLIIKGLSTKTKVNPIKAADIVNAINENKNRYGIKLFSEPRLRKIINFIRSEGILPVMGTSNGYYITKDRNELESQIESLTQRAEAIMTSANGLKKFL